MKTIQTTITKIKERISNNGNSEIHQILNELGNNYDGYEENEYGDKGYFFCLKDENNNETSEILIFLDTEHEVFIEYLKDVDMMQAENYMTDWVYQSKLNHEEK